MPRHLIPPGPKPLTGPGVSNDQLLLQQLQGDLRGRVSIPDQKSAMLIQPEGQEWRAFRNGTLKTVSAVVLLGMIAALVVFYMVRGKIRIDAGPSRRRIQRFNGMERFAHWITAASFLVLALTGSESGVRPLAAAPAAGAGDLRHDDGLWQAGA